MNKMNDVEVIINNKRFTLSGYESEEYLQKVASYINNKYIELKSRESFGRLDIELRNVLLEINIADEFFKAQKKVEELEEEKELKEKAIFNMKHEVIYAETKLEALEKELEAFKKEYNEVQKRIVQLETELKDSKKENE